MCCESYLPLGWCEVISLSFSRLICAQNATQSLSLKNMTSQWYDSASACRLRLVLIHTWASDRLHLHCISVSSWQLWINLRVKLSSWPAVNRSQSCRNHTYKLEPSKHAEFSAILQGSRDEGGSAPICHDCCHNQWCSWDGNAQNAGSTKGLLIVNTTHRWCLPSWSTTTGASFGTSTRSACQKGPFWSNCPLPLSLTWVYFFCCVS